jgi:hypothetical protein
MEEPMIKVLEEGASGKSKQEAWKMEREFWRL